MRKALGTVQNLLKNLGQRGRELAKEKLRQRNYCLKRCSEIDSVISEFHNNRETHLAEEQFQWRKAAGIAPPERHKAYKSCRAIETGLAFMPNELNVCCMLGYTLSPYEGDALPLKDMLERRKFVIELLQKGEYPPTCQSCDQLRDHYGLPSQWLVDFITIAHYTTCNLRCRYCYTVNDPTKTIPAGKIRRLLPLFRYLRDHGYLAPNGMVNFSGGEPTILPEFEELFGLITNYGMFMNIHSNSTILSETIRTGLKCGRISLFLGIDCVTPEVYRHFKGRDLCEEAWETAALYVQENPEMVHAKIVVHPATVGEAGKFVERADSLGFKKILYSLDHGALTNPSEAEIEALAIIRHESERRGLDALFHEKGAPQVAEYHIQERLEERCARLRSHDNRA